MDSHLSALNVAIEHGALRFLLQHMPTTQRQRRLLAVALARLLPRGLEKYPQAEKVLKVAELYADGVEPVGVGLEFMAWASHDAPLFLQGCRDMLLRDYTFHSLMVFLRILEVSIKILSAESTALLFDICGDPRSPWFTRHTPPEKRWCVHCEKCSVQFLSTSPHLIQVWRCPTCGWSGAMEVLAPWAFHQQVQEMAAVIYQDGLFADLPILADSLEDAGCTSQQLLEHFRSSSPHVKGCWALDLLVGK